MAHHKNFDKHFFRQAKSNLPFEWMFWVKYNRRYVKTRQNVMPINESYHISSFRSLRKFNDKLLCLWHLLGLKLPKMERKLKQLLEVPILVNLCFYKEKICVSARVGKSFTKCLLSEFSVRSLSKKWHSGYIWPRSFIHAVKCSLLDEKDVYQSFYGAPLTFRYFLLQWKVLCFARVGKSLARCFTSKPKILSRKLHVYLQLNLTQIVHSNSKMLFL